MIRCSVVLALFALACHSARPAAQSYPVRVLAHDDQGEALTDVRIERDGRLLGKTNAQGALELELGGQEGERVALHASCPDGFAEPSEQPALTLMRFESVDPSAERHTTLRVSCAAKSHVALVALRTGQADLPVLMKGKVVARTSSGGTAHVLVSEAPGSQFQLTLDTSHKPELKPSSPTRLFSVGARDNFAVWDQAFALAPKKKAARKPRADPEQPARPVPYRLD